MSMKEKRHLVEEGISDGARQIARQIHAAGGRACLVGGSIRNLLLGGDAKDWDFATDLKPEELLKLFPRSIDVGARFGTILVLSQADSYEVTTFRKDGLYSDARHPDSVCFTTSLEDDLSRRDFTINALAYDLHKRELIDLHGGLGDLDERVVRSVGCADDRFREDALRMLRCVRIAGQLDFTIEEETYLALVRCARMLDQIARERIREEFNLILAQDRPSVSLERLFETGLMERFLPELVVCYGVSQNRYHAFDVFCHSLYSVDQTPAGNLIVRLAALMHDLGKVDTRREISGRVTFYNHQSWSARKTDAILRRLRYPNEERERVVHLVEQHMFHYSSEWTDAAVRRFIRNVGVEHLENLFATRRADTLGNGLRKTAVSAELLELRDRIATLLEKDAALSVRDLKITGHDLMDTLGVGEGVLIGRILNALLEEVLEDPERNDRETLLRRAVEIRPEIEATLPPRRSRKERY